MSSTSASWAHTNIFNKGLEYSVDLLQMCECWYLQLIWRLAMRWKDLKIPFLLTNLFKSLKTFNSHVHLTPKPCFITSHCEQSNLASVLKLKFIFFLWFLSPVILYLQPAVMPMQQFPKMTEKHTMFKKLLSGPMKRSPLDRSKTRKGHISDGPLLRSFLDWSHSCENASC